MGWTQHKIHGGIWCAKLWDMIYVTYLFFFLLPFFIFFFLYIPFLESIFCLPCHLLLSSKIIAEGKYWKQFCFPNPLSAWSSNIIIEYLKDHLVPTALSWAGIPSLRPGCSKTFKWNMLSANNMLRNKETKQRSSNKKKTWSWDSVLSSLHATSTTLWRF